MAWYNRGKYIFADPVGAASSTTWAWIGRTTSGNVFVALIDDAASAFNADDNTYSDISGDQISGSVPGYTTGGQALGTGTVAEDDANDRAELDAPDLTWSAIGGGPEDTFDAIIIYTSDTIATDPTSDLIAYQSVGATTTNGGDITLQWDAEGILQIA